MTELTDEQKAAIERLESKLEDVPPKERLKAMRGALSITRQEVEEALAKKEKKVKRGRPPKSASGPSAPSS